MLIAQGSTAVITFFLADTFNPEGASQVDPVNVLILINGVIVLNQSFAVNASIVTHVLNGGGWYSITLSPPLTNTLGQLVLQASGIDANTPSPTPVTAFTTENIHQIVTPAFLNPSPTGAPIAIQRGVAIANFPFPMYSPFPNATLMPGLVVSGQRSLDGGAFVTLTSTPSEIGNGWYAVPLTAAETNAAMIALRFSGAGAQDTLVTIATQVA